MQAEPKDEQPLASADSSPCHAHKSTRLFGLLTKRPSKVEPQPQTSLQRTNRSRPVSASAAIAQNSQINSPKKSHDVSFAKCTPERNQQANNVAYNNITKNLEKSQSSSGGLLNIHYRKAKPSKSKTHTHRHSSAETCAQSVSSLNQNLNTTTNTEVIRRKSPKHRSSSHNRFSHQFSLCCKAEKKPLTPPVTVRYNSIPDAVNNVLRRDNLSLSWSLVDNGSLSMNSSDDTATQFDDNKLPIGTTSHGAMIKSSLSECASAPQSPVTAKVVFAPINSNISPSSSSLKSTQSDVPRQFHNNHNKNGVFNTATIAGGAVGATIPNSGPIRPIAVSACRSRLRLKLYPPGKELPPLDNVSISNSQTESMLRATTPQHMSSPNIATQKDFIPNSIEQPDGVRFMSHENIQMQRQASSSGLARQALMAAQVLSLIPTENVRERSFLDGRLGSCSLFGPTELNRIIPSKQITIFVGTWNMNGQSPPKQMNDFVLPATVEHVPDIVAIGTQESSPDRFEWEVTLQETLGPSHVLFHAATLGTLHLAIFMRRDLIWYCSAPEDASLSVRTGSAFRTKGAVAISFCLFGTSMLFVTSHLTAHQQKVKERVSDVKRIIHALDLPKNLNLRHKNKDVTQNFDNVFWCGDLNFRLGEPREKLLEWIQNTKFPLPSHLPHGYMHTDQLSSVLSDGAAFRGFMEANITFPPTYKYDPGTQHFDTSSKQRAPAYTDRILYKYRQTQGFGLRKQSMLPGALLASGGGNFYDPNSTSCQPNVQCLLYDSVPSIITSDHKPVWALFKTLIRAGTDSIPLAAGLFNRDIYLEGMKRRLNNQYSGSSAVCTIQ